MTSKIESVQNEKIKAVVKLALSSKERASRGLFFLEGSRLCGDALNSSLSIDTLFYTAQGLEKHSETVRALSAAAKNTYEVSPAVAKKLSQTQSPQGIFCLVQTALLRKADDVRYSCKYVALENIQDPANFGAIIRTAEALGVHGAILCGCCDVYNPKALRASMGSLLRLPLFQCDDLPQTLQQCTAHGMRAFATTPDETAKKITQCTLNGGVILVIGNEGNGVTGQTMAVCERVTIPMLGRAESLNASMAAAIAMWEMMKQHS